MGLKERLMERMIGGMPAEEKRAMIISALYIAKQANEWRRSA
jgi:hypothetical protein